MPLKNIQFYAEHDLNIIKFAQGSQKGENAFPC